MVTGVLVHVLFAAVGLLPQGGKDVKELASFAVDHTLWLNLAALTVAVGLAILARRSEPARAAS